MDRRALLSAILLSGGIGLSPTVARAAVSLRFRELYARGRELTETAKALEGQMVEMIGYMAPPLKPEIDFFILTKLPMSVCPFCETEAQWPDDIVLALTDGPVDVVRYTDLIRVTGTFEIGFRTDEATGFVSFIRLTGARYEKL